MVKFKPASVTARSSGPLRIVQLANQNASSKNNPMIKPKTRKPRSVFPRLAADHARTARCIRIGQESCGRFCHTPENDGSNDKLTRSASSRHSPPAFNKKSTCKYVADNVTTAAVHQRYLGMALTDLHAGSTPSTRARL